MSELTENKEDYTLQQFEDQNRAIEAEQKSRPIIDTLQNPLVLSDEYKDNELPGFMLGLEYLSSKFAMRRVRGDGNCFYRSLLFSYLEQILICIGNEDEEQKSRGMTELQRFKDIIGKSLQDLVNVGYSEFAVETFHDMFLELLQNLDTMTRESLLEEFQEGGSADHYTWYMRALTAGYMKSCPDMFFPFIEGLYTDISQYCAAEVEPMGKECEQTQILALTKYLGVQAHIYYLSGTYDGKQEFPVHKLPDDDNDYSLSTVYLLYRPGHYDVLYKSESQ
jgi:ubiquitin thioesterase protein OTUB1